MGIVQYCLAVLLYAQCVLNSPMGQGSTYMEDIKKCNVCDPGTFQKSCTECAPCPPGKYTDDRNRETSCYNCFKDCNPKYHLKVVQNCTSTSPLKCVCEPGFKCTEPAQQGNCKHCEKLMDTTASAVTVNKDKQSSSAQTKPCSSPRCGPPAARTTPNPKPTHTSTELAAILGSVVSIGFLALMILFCIYQPRDETCFRQIIAKLCNEKGPNGKAKESTHQFPRDSFSAKQQTSPLSAANLVHVHNPGTVIFSLLSHVTGQGGQTVPDRKRSERESNGEEDERDCPVFHPTPSPSIHLSEEERSGETEDVFFPSQEQGKDYHVSKEEVP